MRRAVEEGVHYICGMRTLLLVLVYSISLPAIAQPKAVNEEKFVTVGGIEQWVTIKGADNTKPAILFLHGGPGSVMSPYQSVVSAWQKDFIIVSWDQRGAGRTFGKNAPANVNEDYWIENPLTVSQMADDAIALSEYLVKHLGKKKIIIIGTSWGSVLGATIALKRPDLYSAYIGHSQVVNAADMLVYSYNKVSQLAKSSNDQASIDKLASIGAPPYDDAKNAGQLFRIIKKYESAQSVPAPAAWWEPAAEYNNEKDAVNRENGDDYSFINFVGHKKMGIKPMMNSIDFMKDGLQFKVPVYLVQGETDILTPKETSRKYFDKLTAPKKEYILVPGAAHGFNQAVVDALYKILKENAGTW
jgi:pimeloyl-ACP methyl ester carboxylesterase